MTIKHLVIPGGGPSGILFLGALEYLDKEKFWNIENIESIYAISVGAIIGILLCFKVEWETINDYIIKRPWHEAFDVNIHLIFNAFSNKGLFSKNAAEIFFKPFLDAKDLSINITMKEFYEISKIELHIFSLEINHFEIVDISYLTHPDLLLLTAVQMSIAIPLIISPVCIDNKCYLDFVYICNNPLNYCVEKYENVEEILGFKNIYEDESESTIITETSNMLDYIINLIIKIFKNVGKKKEKEVSINNQVICNTSYMSFSTINNALSSERIRIELLDKGKEIGKNFISDYNKVKELASLPK
jgi:hypothetical protein